MVAESDTQSVVIVGAGVIGTSAARELAPDHEVRVLEKDQIAANASGHASGMITFSAQRSVLPEAARYSLDFFHDYEGSDVFEFTERPGIELVPEENADSARARAAGAQEAGFPLSYLDADEVGDLYPDVFDLSEYAGGLKFDDTGWLDPYTLTMSLKSDAERNGATFETGVTVRDLRVDQGEVVGVETDDGEVDADAVVVAGGWQTRTLLEEYVEIPVRPLRYQSVHLDPEAPIDPEEFPLGWDPVTGFYWRPEHNGELHVGGGEYVVENPGGVREMVNESFKMDVATQLPERLQGFDRADIVSDDTCPTGDSATPDALPIIDSPADGPGGLVVATGFHGYGIMEAPTGGAAVRSLVTGEDTPFRMSAFELERFDDRSADFDLVSLSEKREKHS